MFRVGMNMYVRTNAVPVGCHDVLRLAPVEATHQVVRIVSVSDTEITAARTLYKHQQTNVYSVITDLYVVCHISFLYISPEPWCSATVSPG